MSPTYIESGWTLTFDPAHWTAVVKWDDDPTVTRAYQKLTGETRRAVHGCGAPGCAWPGGSSQELVPESTRSVDFACVGPPNRPWLIEVKTVVGTQPAKTLRERAMEIASKVRDSLCGLEWAKAPLGEVPDPALKDVRRRLKGAGNVVVLVIVEDQRPNQPVQTVALRAELQRLLAWLRGTVLVIDSSAAITGLQIT